MEVREVIATKALVHVLIRLLYRKVRGNLLSLQGRIELNVPSTSSEEHLTYGEIVSTSFQQLLIGTSDLITSSAYGERVFCDLGCGTGKAVLVSAFGPHGFKRCRGIEIIPSLTTAANEVQSSFNEALIAANNSPAVAAPSISGKKPASTTDATAFLNEIHLLLHENPLTEATLANLLCNRLGSKVFKAHIKSYKSFHAFLLAAAEVAVDSGSLVSSLRRSEDVTEDTIETEEDGQDAHTENNSGVLLQDALRRFPYLASWRQRLPEVLFEIGDVLLPEVHSVLWYEEADFAFAASLLFSDAMMETLQQLVERMRSGSVFVSLKPLRIGPGSRVVLHSESFYQMSWQKANVYVYRIL